MMEQAAFLQSGTIGGLTLKNRIVRAATSEAMAGEGGEVTDLIVDLYRDLAMGGAGLIITGHMFVEPRGQYTPRQTGIHRDDLVAPLRQLTDEVHDQGGVIFAELAHAGSQSLMPDVTPIAPSVIPNAIFARQPLEMTAGDIEEVVSAFGDAAARAKDAGFDGVHIHGGNGYLISEFCSGHANRRQDEWGGDGERRGAFLNAVYGAVRSAVGPDMPVTARIGIADAVSDGLKIPESIERVKSLAASGLDGVETTYGVMTTYRENIQPYVAVSIGRALANGLVPRLFEPAGPEAYYRDFAKVIGQAVDIPVILVGGIRTTDTMHEVIESGDADYVAMARPFIREPDIANQLIAGRRGMVDCVSCNICLMHDGTDPLRCWRKKPRDLAFHVYCKLWRDRRRPSL